MAGSILMSAYFKIRKFNTGNQRERLNNQNFFIPDIILTATLNEHQNNEKHA
jgi:hypothetical protein